MKNAQDYKSNFALYKATIRILERPRTVKNSWWLHNALFECKSNRKDLYQQLKDLINPTKKYTIEDLNKIDSYYVACN